MWKWTSFQKGTYHKTPPMEQNGYLNFFAKGSLCLQERAWHHSTQFGPAHYEMVSSEAIFIIHVKSSSNSKNKAKYLSILGVSQSESEITADG